MSKKHPHIPTPHIEAEYGDFAKAVLMPGDPLRAKYIAENALEDVKLVNNVRNIQGYTGYFNGERISVMGSGMGQPSIAIYSYELFKYYGVETIIRIGSIGGFSKKLHIGDMVLAMSASTNGNFSKQYDIDGEFAATANPMLVTLAYESLINNKCRFAMGNILSSDRFYSPNNHLKSWQHLGVLGVEMEAAALYCNAAWLGKKAVAIATVSDSFVYPDEIMSSKERETKMDSMIKIGLDTVVKSYHAKEFYNNEGQYYIR
ncbi:MAG: purine-nucleoside phosphorylase [Coriobacteriia bacterium]|nr:purine-nucleoside phosphorylase [Coriobacteriia bacterium]